MQKSLLTISSILLLSSTAYAADLSPQEYVDFDTYVLALSWQSGFCQKQSDASKDTSKIPAECQELKNSDDPLSFLTIHGMWPSLPNSLSDKFSISEWHNKGCAAISSEEYPPTSASNKCGAPDVPMSAAFRDKLLSYMPGSSDVSCLHKYEYAKHGVCFGFPPEDYFGTMIRFNSEIRSSAIGNFIKNNIGKQVSTDNFMQVVEDTYGPDARQAVKLSCGKHNGVRYLTEIHVSLGADYINDSLAEYSFKMIDNRGSCGNSFVLNGVNFPEESPNDGGDSNNEGGGGSITLSGLAALAVISLFRRHKKTASD